MAEQKCTIFAKKADYKTAALTIKQYAGDKANFDGAEGLWEKAEARSKSGKLTIFTKVREKPGDEFSGMILGLANYARNSEAKQATEEVKEKVEGFIFAVNIALGVIAEPEFTQTDERLDIVFGLAEKLNGLIYNGDMLLDYNGARVIEFTQL